MHHNGKRNRIVQEFALWVAVSAARQGIKVKGHKLYPFLSGVELSVVTDPERCWSAGEFQVWHRDQVVRLANAANIEVGWAAKLVNMLLKTLVYIGSEGHPSLLTAIHPPIDSRLVDEICRRYSSADRKNHDMLRLCKGGKPIKGIRTYEQYEDVIRGLSQVAAREACSLFEIESL